MLYASVAQLVEQGTENPRVVGSIPIGGTILCGFSSFGRARPCQGRGGGFEPRNPLQKMRTRKKEVSRVRKIIAIREAEGLSVDIRRGSRKSGMLRPQKRIWRHSQAVRQKSAKLLFPSSILGGASKKFRKLLLSEFFIQADEGGLVCNQRACALYVIAT